MRCIELGFIIHTDEDGENISLMSYILMWEKILLIDSLNTYYPVPLNRRYPADEARRIIKCFEIHYAPSMEVGMTSQKQNLM